MYVLIIYIYIYISKYSEHVALGSFPDDTFMIKVNYI